MDGVALLGVGLSVLGVGGPITAAIIKFVPARAPNGCQKPGTSDTCRDHETRIRQCEVYDAGQEKDVEHIKAALARIENHLKQLGGSTSSG